MKVALIHDWLVTLAGAERVLESLYDIYNVPIYTLVKDEDKLKNTVFKNALIYSSFIQKLPKSKSNYRNYLALFPQAIEQFDLSNYDLIISSSHCVAKGVLTNSEQIHICYCHTPVRYAWDMYHKYLKDSNLNNNSIKSIIARLILHYIRIWDYTTSNRVDYYIANSHYIAKRIKKIYNIDAKVIYPPVNIESFNLNTNKEDFYLTASRMVPYKKIDLIVESFRELPDKTLIVIGDGPDFEKIKTLAPKNVKLLGYQDFNVLKDYMQRAKAFIFAAQEDFGIIPVEAQSCGTPIIAYGVGGALETVINNETGVFFYKQTTEDVIKAIKEFENKTFNYLEIRKHAEKFSDQRFKKEFQEYIDNILRTHNTNA